MHFDKIAAFCQFEAVAGGALSQFRPGATMPCGGPPETGKVGE